MDFLEIAKHRQSCRSFDPQRTVEEEKLQRCLQAACLAPSACNSQPYHFTVVRGERRDGVAAATQGMGMNKFTKDAPVLVVVSEASYNRTAALGAKVKGNDYRSIDIGISVAYFTAQADAEGLGTCILGWLDAEKLQALCGCAGTPRLVIALGYARQDDPLRPKKRKALTQLVTHM